MQGFDPMGPALGSNADCARGTCARLWWIRVRNWASQAFAEPCKGELALKWVQCLTRQEIYMRLAADVKLLRKWYCDGL